MYGVDRIILNGDIFELCKYNPHEITRSNSRLLNYFALNDAIYIRGNHDFGGEDGLDHYRIVNSRGRTIHIEHGHKADFFGGTGIGRFLNDALFIALKLLFGVPLIRKAYFGFLNREEGIDIPRKYGSYGYLRYAQALLEKHDVVILGHTHQMEEHRSFSLSAPKIYLNSGTCTFGRFQAIVLDTETLRYEMVRIERNGSVDDETGSRRRSPSRVEGPRQNLVNSEK
jgi:predicted phosphodiesterase